VLIVLLSRLTFAYRSTSLIVIEEARATSDLLKIKIKQRSQRPYEGLGTNDIQDLAIEEKEKKFIVVSDDVGNKIADPEQ
jgi:tartrate dehydratase beta subunit/fumarate hydratase class I family protein